MIGLLSGLAAAQSAPRAQSDRFAAPCIWKPRATAPIDRLEAHAVVLHDKLFIIGGFKNGSLHATARVDVYDPASDAWSTRAPMPEALTHSTIAPLDRRRRSRSTEHLTMR